MKKILTTALFIASTTVVFAQQDYWEVIPPKLGPKVYPAPFVSSENRETPRSVFVSYRNKEQAMINNFDSSQNFINLNGKWDYKTFDSPAAVPVAQIAKPDFEPSGWGSAVLPRAWDTKQGPLSGIKATLPIAEQKAIAGAYSRTFTVPFDYIDKALFLHIGGAKSSSRVYINGKEVGYSQDSKNPAEFDISKYVQRGRNRITILTEGFSKGSYLENQAEWGLEGLNRDIFIFAQPKIRVRDYLVSTTLDPTYTNGLLETALLLKTQLLNTHNVTVYYDLYDPAGRLVNQNSKDVVVGMRGEDTVRFTASIPNVIKWSAETPELYTILYRIKRDTRFTEYFACRVGFRTVEIKDEKLMINGIPAIIKGVNLSEKGPAGNNYIDTVAMRTMLTELKHRGVNAIRTGTSPMPYSFYSLCDELGFYVMDVANLTTQWLGSSTTKGRTIANDPAWRTIYLERLLNSYERNKSHASVIIWGTGDRAGNGYNMYQGYMALREKERSRPIAYDGAGMEFNTDIYTPSFPKEAKNESNRPMIPSRVNFDPAYWNSPDIQGAFLEQWDDAAAALFSNISIEQTDGGRGIYRFTNKLQHTDLDKFPVTYTVTKGRKVVTKGLLTVSAAPNGGTASVTIPKGGVGKGRKLTIRVGNLAQQTFQ